MVALLGKNMTPFLQRRGRLVTPSRLDARSSPRG
jgi:hypothetical protein